MSSWKVTIKEVGEPVYSSIISGDDMGLDDIRRDFGLDSADVEWYSSESMKGVEQ
jgi:hypothetical protein